VRAWLGVKPAEHEESAPGEAPREMTETDFARLAGSWGAMAEKLNGGKA
jgi:hypothetical protein